MHFCNNISSQLSSQLSTQFSSSLQIMLCAFQRALRHVVVVAFMLKLSVHHRWNWFLWFHTIIIIFANVCRAGLVDAKYWTEWLVATGCLSSECWVLSYTDRISLNLITFLHTHLNIGDSIGQIWLQVGQSSYDTFFKLWVRPTALFDVRSCWERGH